MAMRVIEGGEGKNPGKDAIRAYHAAAEEGDFLSVRRFVEMYPQHVDVRYGKDNATALIAAAGTYVNPIKSDAQNDAIVEFLLNKGADAAIRTDSGRTALSATIETHNKYTAPIVLKALKDRYQNGTALDKLKLMDALTLEGPEGYAPLALASSRGLKALALNIERTVDALRQGGLSAPSGGTPPRR